MKAVALLAGLLLLTACGHSPQPTASSPNPYPGPVNLPEPCIVLNAINDSLGEIGDPYSQPNDFIESVSDDYGRLDLAIEGRRESLPGLAEGMERLRRLVREVIETGTPAKPEQIEAVRAEIARVQDDHLPGCQVGDEPSPVPPPDPDQEEVEGSERDMRKPGDAPPKFSSYPHKGNYEAAYGLCRAFGLKEVAKEFGTAQDPVSAAEGYASQFEPAFQQAPFEGCLDGLLSKQKTSAR